LKESLVRGKSEIRGRLLSAKVREQIGIFKGNPDERTYF